MNTRGAKFPYTLESLLMCIMVFGATARLPNVFGTVQSVAIQHVTMKE